MAEYKGTYNPDKKRGELLKDNVATGDYFSDKKGVFKNTSGLDLAKERAEELNNPKKTNKALGMKSGGKVSSASKRADGCAVKGKTRGKMC